MYHNPRHGANVLFVTACQGRVLIVRDGFYAGVAPLGLAMLGPLGDVIGARTPFVLSGAVVLLMPGIVVLTASVRSSGDGRPAQPLAWTSACARRLLWSCKSTNSRPSI